MRPPRRKIVNSSANCMLQTPHGCGRRIQQSSSQLARQLALAGQWEAIGQLARQLVGQLVTE